MPLQCALRFKTGSCCPDIPTPFHVTNALPLQCALRCQDWVLLLSQLFSCTEVVAACPHAASVWEPLGVEWRKITLAAHDA
eukprot:scaffold144644_cov19-Tisochrysis_lutea.AAC.1